MNDEYGHLSFVQDMRINSASRAEESMEPRMHPRGLQQGSEIELQSNLIPANSPSISNGSKISSGWVWPLGEDKLFGRPESDDTDAFLLLEDFSLVVGMLT